MFGGPKPKPQRDHTSDKHLSYQLHHLTSGNSNIVAKYLPLKKSSKKIVIEVYQEDPHLKLAPGWGLGSEG